MSASIRVAILDKNQFFRRGLAATLSSYSEISVASEISEPSQADNQVDVVVLNLSFASTGFFEALREAREAIASVPLLVLGTVDEAYFSTNVLKAGATAYLRADCSEADLLEAIKTIKNGRLYLSSAASASVAHQLKNRTADREPFQTLSDREQQIFSMICDGLPLVRIGSSFSISVKTVSTYRARILKKMNMKSNAELVRYAVEKKLVSIAS